VSGNFVAVVGDSETAADTAAAKLAPKISWETKATLPDQADLRKFLRTRPAETTSSAHRDGATAATQTHKFEFFRPYVSHASIGLCCAIACFRDGRMEAWSHSQSIFELRKDIALSLGLELENVVVHHTEGAGCYGHNGADDVALRRLPDRISPSVGADRVQWGARTNWAGRRVSPAMLVEVEAGVDDQATSWGAPGYLRQWTSVAAGEFAVAEPTGGIGNDGTIRDTSFEKPADCKRRRRRPQCRPIYGTAVWT